MLTQSCWVHSSSKLTHCRCWHRAADTLQVLTQSCWVNSSSKLTHCWCWHRAADTLQVLTQSCWVHSTSKLMHCRCWHRDAGLIPALSWHTAGVGTELLTHCRCWHRAAGLIPALSWCTSGVDTDLLTHCRCWHRAADTLQMLTSSWGLSAPLSWHIVTWVSSAFSLFICTVTNCSLARKTKASTPRICTLFHSVLSRTSNVCRNKSLVLRYGPWSHQHIPIIKVPPQLGLYVSQHTDTSKKEHQGYASKLYVLHDHVELFSAMLSALHNTKWR